MVNLVNLNMKLDIEFEGFKQGTPMGVCWDYLIEELGMDENEAINHVSKNMPINPKLGAELRGTYGKMTDRSKSANKIDGLIEGVLAALNVLFMPFILQMQIMNEVTRELMKLMNEFITLFSDIVTSIFDAFQDIANIGINIIKEFTSYIKELSLRPLLFNCTRSSHHSHLRK